MNKKDNKHEKTKSLEQINEDYYKELGELLLLTDDAPDELCIFVKKIDENGFEIVEKKNIDHNE